jgi:predicted nucleic acid-binding protein
MIVVDSSVWIDYFNGVDNPYTAKLDALLGVELIAIGDIILTEILQGFQSDKDFKTAKFMLLGLAVFDMLGQQNAITAAENYRYLRKKGITIRKTIDCMIATFCIQNDHELLFRDKDFQPFVEHLGLGAVGS